MASQASTCKAFQAIDVAMAIDGLPVRAVVTREAMEASWGPVGPQQDHLLEAYRAHRVAIEAEILRRYQAEQRPLIVIREDDAAAGSRPSADRADFPR